MKKIFLLLASVFFSTMMFAQVLLWKDGEVIYSKNIDEVDKISFYEVEDFELVNDEVELMYYGYYGGEKTKWIHVEFSPKKSYGVLEYKSSDEDIVTVSYDGYLVARGIGEATVTVKLIGTELEQKCKVVVKGYEGSLQFNNDYVYLLPGQVYDELRGYISFEPYCWECREDLEWASSNEKVATVDENGKVIAVAEGQAIITAKLKNTKTSASTIVKVEDVEMGIMAYDGYGGNYQEVEVLKLGVGGFKGVFVYFKDNENNNYYPSNFEYEWISMDKSVVLFTNANSSTYYEQELMGVAAGEADVIVKIVGTEIEDTIKVVVKPTDPMTVQFYDVLWGTNGREYPLDYDYNGDGDNDVVLEGQLWLLGSNLNWVDGERIEGEDYYIYVPIAWVSDGTSYYVLGNYNFMDSYWEDDYLTEYNGEKYFKPLCASNSYFNDYSYCKYYEQYYTTGEWPNADDFLAEYGWWLKQESSYIYYLNTETGDEYITGLVRHGDFSLTLDELDRGTTDICISYMSMGLEFFADTPNGLRTEMVKDEETGEMVETFVTPFEMAPMIYRDIYFSNEYYAPQQKASMKMQGISEKALKANQLLNIPLQMKLQDIRF